MRTLVAVASDTHCLSTVGLCPPQPIQLDDGGWLEPSMAQRWLWDCWKAQWDRVDELRGDELRIILNGDLVDGPGHHGTHQSMSMQSHIQSQIIHDTLEVPLSLGPDSVFIVRGTESHVGKGGTTEEAIARGLRDAGHAIEGDPDTGQASWYEVTMDVQGRTINATHHGRTGNRPWTGPNATLMLAAQIYYERSVERMQQLAQGMSEKDATRVPDLAFRSHYHKHYDSYDAHPVRVIQMPAYQLRTAYIYRRHVERLADIGGCIAIIEDGRITGVEKVLFKPRRGSTWYR
jgi:hypothetical protein